LHTLRFLVVAFILLVGASFKFQTVKEIDLTKTKWIHGSQNCKSNHDPLIQVAALNSRTWILRQNKCVHYEAPFIFLFAGKDENLLVDTGATTDEKTFPLRHVVDSIVESNGLKKKLVVAHTHSHSDHIAADAQFKTRENTEVIGVSWEEVQRYFGLTGTTTISTLDLGKRAIKILSVPGHHQTSVAFYDPQTKLLFTGDSFYPGRLYVRDWPAFKESIKRMLAFAKENNVVQCIGNHIEMSDKKGTDYPVGTTYQPEEHILPLTIAQLEELDKALDALDLPKRDAHDDFIIVPK
jgi:glyoxylase-like metal-dependent hydrolase (beta-lactamase superfamily II)